MQMLFEKSESHDGGRRTMKRVPMRHRVVNDMTIGDTPLHQLFRSLFGLRRLVDNGDLVLQ